MVLSQSLDLPDQAQLWDTAIAPTLVAHGSDADPQRLSSGPEALSLSLCEPLQLMEALAERGCNQVLWECGPALAAAAIQQNCVQEVVTVVAPKLMGGMTARTPLGDLGFVAMDQVLQGAWHRCEPLGHDWLLRWRSGLTPLPALPIEAAGEAADQHPHHGGELLSSLAQSSKESCWCLLAGSAGLTVLQSHGLRWRWREHRSRARR